MPIDPRTPVLVGVGTRTQRLTDERELDDASSPIDLMVDAARDAAGDSGTPGLLDAVTWVGVPEGTWRWRDPGRAVAERLGVAAHSVVAEVGVLQHALWQEATRLIAEGRLDTALVVGGEARHRERFAARAGLDLPAEPDEPGEADADERWHSDDVGISEHELTRGLHQPAAAYALLERAIGAAAGRTGDEHLEAVGALWEGFGRVAAGVEGAWDRTAPTADAIVTPTDENRMVSSPYPRLLCSQWNVDQAAALLLTSAETARSAGVPEERWVFPLVLAENRTTEPVTQRPDLARLTGAEVAARAFLAAAGPTVDGRTHVDLYSCFPAAVQLYAGALGLPLDRQLTVTGGMTFYGGPLNNYVVQSTAEMARVLRADPGSSGVVTNVSGFVSKQGFDLWSTTPPESGRPDLVDVTDEVARRHEQHRVAAEHDGPCRIVTWTVSHARGTPWEALVVAETPSGDRVLLRSQSPEVLTALSQGDWIDRPAQAASGGDFDVT